MTSPAAIQKANELAKQLADLLKPHGVNSVRVDDWSDYGLFGIFVKLDLDEGSGIKTGWRPRNKTFNLRKITMGIRSFFRKNDLEPSFDPPLNVYHCSTVNYTTYRNWEGYDRCSILVNVRIDDPPVPQPKQPDLAWRRWYQETYPNPE
jgi:hypothetical protein